MYIYKKYYVERWLDNVGFSEPVALVYSRGTARYFLAGPTRTMNETGKVFWI